MQRKFIEEVWRWTLGITGEEGVRCGGEMNCTFQMLTKDSTSQVISEFGMGLPVNNGMEPLFSCVLTAPMRIHDLVVGKFLVESRSHKGN